MNKIVSLDENYSTTRLLTKEKHESVFFLPEGEERKGEGGLRTQGYFKKSADGLPLISIITVVYNGEKFLEETILSVINQTYDNVEYIIIDGGSSDGTLDIIKKYEDQIDNWVSERDSGIYDAMNKGIDLVSGEWINFMNAGDVFYTKEVLTQVFTAENYNNTEVIYGDLEIDYGEFKRFEKVKPLNNIYKGMVFSHQSCFINATFHKQQKYGSIYNIAGDFEFFYNAYKQKKSFQYISMVVSTMDVEGLSDGNRFQTISQHHSVVNRYNLSLKNNIYYVYLYSDQFLRKVIKFFLPNFLIDIVKKNK